MKNLLVLLATAFTFLPGSTAFVPSSRWSSNCRQSTSLFAEEGAVAGPLVSGEELEMILTELEKPLVIDAYATWSVAVELLLNTVFSTV